MRFAWRVVTDMRRLGIFLVPPGVMELPPPDDTMPLSDASSLAAGVSGLEKLSIVVAGTVWGLLPTNAEGKGAAGLAVLSARNKPLKRNAWGFVS